MTLALFGGKPTIDRAPKKYSWFGGFKFKELENIIIESKLSGFLANPNDSHFGGEMVSKFEKAWRGEFEVDFAFGFNSWTSGLEACIAALGLPPKSEVLVPAWTMSATAASIVTNNLIPHFVDVSLDDFNLDIEKIVESISPRTSAILGVDIFGKPCKADKLRKICDFQGLKLIVDAAQTPKARISGRRSTYFSDVGGYSLNRHKHLQTGEGGVAVTNDPIYGERIALYRNHAEVTNLKEDQTITIGHNLRMGEIEALLGEFQLSKIDKLVDDRRFFGNYLRKGLQKFSWLIFAEEETYIEHDYYILGMRINYLDFPISRKKLIEALLAEGLQGVIGEYAQLHKLRSFQDFPRSDMQATENLFNDSFIGIYLCGNDYSIADLDLIIDAFEKITRHRDEIRLK